MVQEMKRHYAHNTLMSGALRNIPVVAEDAVPSQFAPGELEANWHVASEEEYACYKASLVPSVSEPTSAPTGDKLVARTLCEVSTGNITRRDRELLSLGDEGEILGQRFGMLRASFLYGAFVNVPAEILDSDGARSAYEKGLRDQGFSEEFLTVLNLARAQGYDFVMFDSDASAVEGLPLFE